MQVIAKHTPLVLLAVLGVVLFSGTGRAQKSGRKSPSPVARALPAPFWIDDDLPRARYESRMTGRPILMACVERGSRDCKWMEDTMFARPRIRELLGRFVLLRMHVRRDSARSTTMVRYNFSDVPSYTLMTADDSVFARLNGKTRSEKSLLAFVDTEEPDPDPTEFMPGVIEPAID